MVDNGFKAEGGAFRRFYLNRVNDQTGISRTGRVLEGILTQSGKVFVEWRPPHSTMGIYNSLTEFKTIHVDCHPSCNEIVWLDDRWCHYCGFDNPPYSITPELCYQCECENVHCSEPRYVKEPQPQVATRDKLRDANFTYRTALQAITKSYWSHEAAKLAQEALSLHET